MIDPYQVLGLSKNADQEDIKKSYRKLAKKYHPDLNPGNKEAEKKFKDVSHAFDMIGTSEARAKYDRGETDEQQQQQYKDFMKRGQRPSYYDTQHEGGRYSYSFGEDFGGEDFFENLFGRSRGHHMDFPGEDIHYKMEIDFIQAALGSEKVITLRDGKNLKVKIPAGIESGKKLRFKGLGSPGAGRGVPGDAYIEIVVRPLEGFIRRGQDIETELPISFIEAITGGEVEAPTIDGTVLLTIPPGVSSGTKLRIKGKGAGEGEKRGNQIVVLKIVMPRVIDPSLRAAAENLKGQFNYNPRMNS
ncbi:MAG: J domain-containing protein [Bacteriovoracaceae bacterium]|nr:J domain-containing protein [Bacteriovoracaceae bacterium]